MQTENSRNSGELPKPPLSRFLVADTSSFDEALEAASKAFCDHKQEVLGKADSFRYRLHHASLQKTAIMRASYGADTYINAGQPETIFLINLPQTGSNKYWHEGQIVEATPDMGVVSSPTLPLRFNFGATCSELVVTIDRKALEDHLCALTGASIKEPIVFQPHLKTGSGIGAQVKRLLGFLVAELDAGDSLQDNPLFVSNIEQAMMTALLTGQPHNYSARFEKPLPLAADWQVRRVEEYIRAHATEPITIGELSILCGQSERALFYAFKKYRGYTPMTFLRAMRLLGARETLLKGEPGMTVTIAAMEWSFIHLGRFSAEYAKEFGESPSETLRKGEGIKSFKSNSYPTQEE